MPRQEILEQVAKPLDPGAEVLNSFVFRRAEIPYKESAGNNGTGILGRRGRHRNPGVEKAKEMLDGARPTVRVLYNKDDPDRGRNMPWSPPRPAGWILGHRCRQERRRWLPALSDGAFDVALYGWTSNPTGSIQVPQVFRTGAVSNLNNFSNTVVDQLTEQLAVNPDEAKENALKMQIDQLVVEAGYGLPLFQRTVLSRHRAARHGSAVFAPGHWPLAQLAQWAFVK